MGQGYFSCDVDTGKVVAKTDIRSDGTVGRYTYTSPDYIQGGHGHEEYESVDDFLREMNKDKSEPQWKRDKDDPDSINRRWKGNGYDLGINDLMSLSYSELQMIADVSIEGYVHSTFEMMTETLVSQAQPKTLILKK